MQTWNHPSTISCLTLIKGLKCSLEFYRIARCSTLLCLSSKVQGFVEVWKCLETTLITKRSIQKEILEECVQKGLFTRLLEPQKGAHYLLLYDNNRCHHQSSLHSRISGENLSDKRQKPYKTRRMAIVTKSWLTRSHRTNSTNPQQCVCSKTVIKHSSKGSSDYPKISFKTRHAIPILKIGKVAGKMSFASTGPLMPRFWFSVDNELSVLKWGIAWQDECKFFSRHIMRGRESEKQLPVWFFMLKFRIF